MKFYRIFRVFQVMNACAQWYEKAMDDGQITAAEASQLITTIAGILGYKVNLEVKPEDQL